MHILPNLVADAISQNDAKHSLLTLAAMLCMPGSEQVLEVMDASGFRTVLVAVSRTRSITGKKGRCQQ